MLYAFDAIHHTADELLCGVDEAGRGPLCGPVSVAAVVLDAKHPIDGLDDSKKLTEKKREALYTEIVNSAISWKVVFVSPAAIDRYNISQATLIGMRKAVEALPQSPHHVLVDGNQDPDLGLPTTCVVQGDAKSACIAAASILAKVERDRYMKKLGEKHPQYKLEQHKGYPTKQHYELLDQHGPQPFYRLTFLRNWSGKLSPQKLGNYGEFLVTQEYVNQGFAILQNNYRTRHGEIDVVAKHDDLLVFIEVKTRRDASVQPAEWVDEKKQQWLQEHPDDSFVRFDVAEVVIAKKQMPQINCITDAFSL